jgi:putative SOS response-associated peptidase YedK
MNLVRHELGFLTTEPNAEVQAIHPKAMPVILQRGVRSICGWRGS